MIELLNNWGSSWLNWFIPALVQNTVFLGIILLILHRLRNHSAQLKYTIGMIGVFKVLLPPFLPARLKTAMAALTGNPPVDFNISSSVPPPPSTLENLAAVSPHLNTVGIIILIWFLIILIYTFYVLFSTIRLKSILKNAEPVNQNSALLQQHQIGLYQSSRISMPLSLGPFPKKIYVPLLWQKWTDNCRNMILQHELAHIKRRDGLFQLFQILMQAVYFFHPLAYILNRQINEYREMACDDASAGIHQDSSLEYSRYLVEIAEKLVQNPLSCTSASALIKQKHELVKRIKYQIMEAKMKTLSTARRRFIFGGLILLIIPLSWYYTTAHPVITEPAIQEQDKKKENQDYMTITNLHIQKDGMFKFRKKILNLTELDTQLMKIKQKSKNIKNTVIGISCDEGVTMGMVSDVHEHLRKWEILNVSYMTRGQNHFNLTLPPKFLSRELPVPKKDVASLMINDNAQMLYNEKHQDKESLGSAIEEGLRENPNLIISIVHTQKVKYDAVQDILKTVRGAGAKRITIGKLPPPPPPPSKIEANKGIAGTVPTPPPIKK